MQNWMNKQRLGNAVLMKERCYFCIYVLGTRLEYNYRRLKRLFGGRFEMFGHRLLFCFSPFIYISFSRSIPPNIFDSLFNALRMSSSFLLITIHWCIPALFGTRQDALRYVLFLRKCSIWNMQTAFLAPPFLISAWFVTAKYCQTSCCNIKKMNSEYTQWHIIESESLSNASPPFLNST